MASILLVDDNDEFLAMLSEVLERAGYQVQQASDGQQALDLYKIHKADLVITDLVMPENEGIQLIIELRRLNPKTKIIAISGAGQGLLPEYLKMAKVLGAQRVLAKPFSEQEILEAISQLLEGA